jgi:pyruvate/2-oxoglutarate dehydrogenase complex dihydrolipoamide dehydrogenase (E3) component
MPQQFDAIIIGTGQAGPPLARRLAGAKMRVAIVERGKFGGTCVNTGCIPTKAMVASAYAAHMVRRAAEFGISASSEIKADMKAVMARKERISAHSRTAVESGLRNLEGCTVFTGHARFEAPGEISVGQVSSGEPRLRAPKIFLNVGARARINIAGADQTPFLTNSSMMDLDSLPRHLVIVGGGAIGLEFAQMFRRFGSEVTVIEMSPRLAAREDEDVSAAIREILEREGVVVRPNAKCIRLAKEEGGVVVTLDCEGESQVHGSHVLLAVGRRPNTDDLGLEKAGVQIDARGYVQVDDQLRTNVEGVWAMGDCNGKGAFTHTSYNDYEIAAANLLDNDPRRVSDRIIAYATYIDPPLGRVGMTQAEVRGWMEKTGKHALIATRPMEKVGRAVEKGETQGFMKIMVDAESKQILGAAILGTGGDEAIHSILDVMYAKAPYTVIQRAVNIHPTVCELIPTMLGDLKPLV